ncbi:hypothetical protein HanXRQr2_Chr15g0711171 [Helianthus annuus]|uniref:Uncharacterized protein n=1 Tax=Helianthus annuus TaxID=4232 RepID=A0A9K3E490_HELAN|nr:hypothetical protein HanXRQr2_Chr15g0711171 [Helianthus annuus]KAJ0457446.1 hypothetical protein HanIR_Chr15g0773831 [Helianthus annuus]KAJ0474422.1 hypothetical protein HanHA89_Chr15g0629541 [Helianthus annuus]KAJ0832774.1 hypothetical protein HanPSC8_Chr15g0682541 [Helianthus annuus]
MCIKFLKWFFFSRRNGYTNWVGSYELVVETYLLSSLFVLAGKVIMRMTNICFIPYIKARQKVHLNVPLLNLS